METKEFKFNGTPIEFEINNKKVMVNATQMAKIFGRDLFQFTKSDHAKAFIESCNKPAFAGLLGIEKEEDLIISRQKSGTWMHRVLALKFAAWLNSDFEVWIYLTIDDLLFGSYKEDEESLKEIGRIQAKIAAKEDELKNLPVLKDIEDLKKDEAKERRKLELRKKIRISNFRTMFSEDEMMGEK
ncbi:MAG: KilA-N domain-containing protein [Tannerella sp.]|jgi:hypothetical protein|nr:KilA-N domain-containing protein [Tannerella sp.]